MMTATCAGRRSGSSPASASRASVAGSNAGCGATAAGSGPGATAGFACGSVVLSLPIPLSRSALHEDGLLAVGADGDDRDRQAEQGAEPVDVAPRRRRQVAQPTRAGDVLAPA